METKTYTFAELQERAKNCEWLFFDSSNLLACPWYFYNGKYSGTTDLTEVKYPLYLLLEIPKKDRNENLMLHEIYEQLEDVEEAYYPYDSNSGSVWTNKELRSALQNSNFTTDHWTRKDWKITKRKSDQLKDLTNKVAEQQATGQEALLKAYMQETGLDASEIEMVKQFKSDSVRIYFKKLEDK